MLSQAGRSQASLVDSTLSFWQRVYSPRQAGLRLQIAGREFLPGRQFPRLPQVDGTLSLAESALSQAGSSQASQEENTLSPAESELSKGSSPSSPEDGTLQAESTTSPQAVRCSARLRARQAGNPSREISEVSQ